MYFISLEGANIPTNKFGRSGTGALRFFLTASYVLGKQFPAIMSVRDMSTVKQIMFLLPVIRKQQMKIIGAIIVTPPARAHGLMTYSPMVVGFRLMVFAI